MFKCRYRMAEVEWVQDIPPRDATDREDVTSSLFLFPTCIILSN